MDWPSSRSNVSSGDELLARRQTFWRCSEEEEEVDGSDLKDDEDDDYNGDVARAVTRGQAPPPPNDERGIRLSRFALLFWFPSGLALDRRQFEGQEGVSKLLVEQRLFA